MKEKKTNAMESDMDPFFFSIHQNRNEDFTEYILFLSDPQLWVCVNKEKKEVVFMCVWFKNT